MVGVSPQEKRKNTVAVVLLAIFASIGYAVVNDQITVQVCPEYFTVGHALIFGQQPLPVLGLLWGLCAGFFPGLALGIVLAIVCSKSQRTVRATELIRPIATLLLVMAAAAVAAGLFGWWLSLNHQIEMPQIYATRLEASKHPAFFADWFAHGAAYFVGYAGALVIIRNVWRKRAIT
jgi:uncharacterized membrane protein YedE/YeeE